MENLTKAQKHVLRLIFEHKKTEEEAIEDAKISAKVYDGWFRQKVWLTEYEECLQRCKRRADLIISSYKETAAIKLITLTDCKKDDIARRSCLDILGVEIEITEPESGPRTIQMKPETQAAILKIMKDEKDSVASGEG